MKRWLVALLFIGLTVAPSTVFASQVGKSLGNLRWGMSDTEVMSVVKGALQKEYGKRIKKARGTRKESLKSEAKRRLRDFKSSHTEFTGRSRWDRSAVSGEFTHGNDESMLVLEGTDSDNYYFFIEGRLWKWVKVLPAHQFGGGFKKFAKSVKKKFGRGHEKNGELTRGSGDSFKFIEFLDRNNRMRAVNGYSGTSFALVFEEMATVRNLSALRVNQPSRSKSRSTMARSSSSSSPSTTLSSTGKSGGKKKRRSIFADESSDESAAAYNQRKKKVLAERKRKQRALYERKKENKKGKVLDELTGIEDDDPLAGMR